MATIIGSSVDCSSRQIVNKLSRKVRKIVGGISELDVAGS